MCNMPRPPHSSWLDHPNIIWGVQMIKLLFIQYSLLHCYLFPLRPKYLPQHLFSNTLNLYSSLNVRDQVSHPYKQQAKWCYCITQSLYFLDSKLEDDRFCIEWYQPFPDSNLLLISSQMKFLFLGVVYNIWTVSPFRRIYHTGLNRLLTFQVTNLESLFHSLWRTTGSVHDQYEELWHVS